MRRLVAALAAWIVLSCAHSVAPDRFVCGGQMRDPRDGATYATFAAGSRCWFAEALRYAAAGSHCYGDDASQCARYGRMYPWEVALSSCPPGWHLSTEYDWRLLERELGVPEEQLEAVGNRGDPAGTRFRALLGDREPRLYGGWRQPDGSYEAAGRNAALWTSAEYGATHGWHRDIAVNGTAIYREPVYKPFAISVLCVRNALETDAQWVDD